MTTIHTPIPIQQDARSLTTPTGSAGGFDEQAREYFYILRAYRRLILSITGMCVLGALTYIFLVTPQYSASTTIRVGVYRPALQGVDEGVQDVNAGERYLDTQLQELQSLSLADRVLHDPQILKAIQTKIRQDSIISSPEFSTTMVDENATYTHSLKELQAYHKSIRITPIRKTSLLVVSATSSHPSLAARIANHHAQEYINWTRSIRIKEQQRGLIFLRSQEKDLRAETATLEKELAQYAEDNALLTLSEKEHSIVRALEQLQEQHQKVVVERIKLQKQYEEMTASEQGKVMFDDEAMQTMREELAVKKAELRQLQAKFKPEYPKVKQLASQVQGLVDAIQSHYESMIVGASSRLKALIAEEAELAEELERKKSIAFDVARKQVRYNIIQRELQSNEQLLDHVLREMKQTSLAAQSNASHITLVDPALIPDRPSAPRKKLILFLSLFGGLAFGTGLAFILRSFDDSIRNLDDLASATMTPALGLIPSFGDRAEVEKSSPLKLVSGNEPFTSEDSELPVVSRALPMYLQEPLSIVSESFRTVRTNILISQAGSPPGTLLITSAQAGEGKTTVALNVAAALASTGASVVIVDADLRRPRVLDYFGLSQQGTLLPGVVEVVTGHVQLQEAIIDDVDSRISVLPSGHIPPNPAELLGSLEMATLLDGLSRQYDFVIIDSPPVLPLADALVLAQIVDGTILVTQAGRTATRLVRDSVSKLRRVGARVLGSVLNNVNLSSDEYYYYQRYYNDAYNYQKDGSEVEVAAASVAQS